MNGLRGGLAAARCAARWTTGAAVPAEATGGVGAVDLIGDALGGLRLVLHRLCGRDLTSRRARVDLLCRRSR